VSYNFSNITSAIVADADVKPGHSDIALFAPMDEFTTIAVPGAWAAAGDYKKITTAHTFPALAGFSQLKSKPGRVRQEGTTAVGEKGGLVPVYQYIIAVKGHSAVIEEWLEQAMNLEGIWLFNSPECGVNEYIQLGSSCNPAEMTAYTSKSGSRNEGGVREYEITLQSNDKYWYSGTVTVKA
jgi:hypothetical protein